MRVAFFSEGLRPPFDEGVKNVAQNLLRHLAGSHEVLALTSGGADIPELGVENVAANRLLVSRRLRSRIREFAPDRVCYLPPASMTGWSFLRARALRAHSAGAPVTMIALQPRRIDWLTRLAAASGMPALVVVQSERTRRRLADLKVHARFVPVGVDRDRFAPATEARRHELRRRFALDPAAKVVLHVGHVKRNRNVEVLASLQQLDGVQTVLLGSSSTASDSTLAAELAARGVRVITGTLADPEALYRLADLYVFPCPTDRPAEMTPAIETPLSVLEAMSCGLPLVATRFGGLPDLFEPGGGVVYVAEATNTAEWRRAVLTGLATSEVTTRVRTACCSWRRFAEAALGLESTAA